MSEDACTAPCCADRREREWAWQLLIELYRVLVRAGAGSSQQPHAYSFNRRKTAQDSPPNLHTTTRGEP